MSRSKEPSKTAGQAATVDDLMHKLAAANIGPEDKFKSAEAYNKAFLDEKKKLIKKLGKVETSDKEPDKEGIITVVSVGKDEKHAEKALKDAIAMAEKKESKKAKKKVDPTALDEALDSARQALPPKQPTMVSKTIDELKNEAKNAVMPNVGQYARDAAAGILPSFDPSKALADKKAAEEAAKKAAPKGRTFV